MIAQAEPPSQNQCRPSRRRDPWQPLRHTEEGSPPCDSTQRPSDDPPAERARRPRCSSSPPVRAPGRRPPRPAVQPSAAASAGGSAAAGGEEYVIAAATDAKLGAFLTGEDGKTLYVFTPDSANTSTCVDACATNWPPLVVDVDRHAQGRRRRDRQAHDVRATGRHDAGRLQRHPAVLLRQGHQGRRRDRPGRRSASGSSPPRPARCRRPAPQSAPTDPAPHTQKRPSHQRGPFRFEVAPDQPPGVSQTG